MKVCVVSPELLPTWGGVGTYTYNLARGLRDEAELHVLTADRLSNAEESEIDGVHVHTVAANGGAYRRPSSLRFQVAVMRSLPKLMEENEFDIIHANHAYMSDLLARLRGVQAARVATIHTTLDTQIGGTRHAGASAPRGPGEGKVSRWRFLLQKIESSYLSRTPSMIFVSNWVRSRLYGRYGIAPRLGTVIPNAVDAGEFVPNGRFAGDPFPDDASDRPTLLFVGRLLAMKGVDILLRSMRRVNPSVRLLLAGPGDAAPWRARARSLGLADPRVTFLGPVPYAEMPALYHQADAVVLPSFTESCPMVALEAMATGAPLIAAKVGGVPEVVQDEQTGWLVAPGDAKGLAQRIETVLAESERAREVSEAARAWVEDHATIPQMAEDTMRFYGRVLQGELP